MVEYAIDKANCPTRDAPTSRGPYTESAVQLMTNSTPEPRYRARRRNCDLCDTEYEYRGGRSKYCSTTCRNKAERLRDVERYRAKKRADYQKHAEKRKAQSARWREENYEHHLEVVRAYRIAHPEVAKENERQRDKGKKRTKDIRYKEKNREKLAAAQREYHKEHPEAAARAYAKRRVLLETQVREFTKAHWSLLLRAYEGRCAYCNSPMDKPTMDHVVPLSQGGAHCWTNIVPACLTCNLRKHTQTWTPRRPDMWPEIERVAMEREAA